MVAGLIERMGARLVVRVLMLSNLVVAIITVHTMGSVSMARLERWEV